MASKTRVDLRLDDDVHRGLKQLAEEAGLSLNQVLGGILRWANQNAHVGRPIPGEVRGMIASIDDEDVIWFGKSGQEPESDVDEGPSLDGDVVFVLDFSGRAAVRPSNEYGFGEDRG